MAKQVVDVGSKANDGSGDSLREAGLKINANFTEVYSALGGSSGNLSVVSKLTGANGMIVSNPTGDITLTNRIATTSQLGVIKVGNNLSINSEGVLSANAGAYTLPTATGSVLGGVKVGSGLSISNGILSADVQNATSLVNGANTVSLGSTGVLTFPNGLLKIAGNKIRNVNESVGLIAGSEIEVTVAKTVISNGVTDTEGPSTQHIFEVGSTRIFSALQVVNSLSEGGPSLTSQQLTELTTNGFKIGYRVINDLGDSSPPVIGFSGWNFGTVDLSQALTYPNTALQRDTVPVTCTGNASTVVYTALGQFQHTIRLLIQVEGLVGAAVDADTQACEMIIAKSFRANDIAASVYGVVHTSAAPLATFTADWNALTNRVEVLCTTPSANTVTVRIFATEITTSEGIT